MKCAGTKIGWMGTVLLLLAGSCSSPTTQLWPWAAPPNEEFVLPPEGDPRFSEPPVFPKSVTTPTLRKEPELPGRPGMSPGTGPTQPTPGGSFPR